MFPSAWLHRRLPVALLSAALIVPAGPAMAQGPRTPAEKGKKHALLVGVRKYDSIKFDALKYTENDVEELARILSGAGGFSGVRLLTTTRSEKNRADAPTAKNVRTELQALLARKTRNDMILVGLSGHGIQTKGKSGDESFFCPADAQLNDTSTLVSLTGLVKDLNACGAGVKLLLADACRNDPGAGRSVDVETLPRLPRGTAALFSCKSGERAFESPRLGKGHGVFFFHVLEGLRGKARDARGAVTWTRLAEYVTETVSEEVPGLIGGGARQTPEWKVNLTGKAPVLIPPSGIPAEAARLFELAHANLYGAGRRVDEAQAVRLFRRAADKGHPLAAGFVGLCYRFGMGVPRDSERADRLCAEVVEQAREAARKGDVAGQVLLGMMCHVGAGVARDDKAAVRWLREAAAGGSPWAQDSLGNVYRHGQGAPKDYGEALRWYRKAAAQDCAWGQYNVGAMHLLGEGVPKDYAEAHHWYRKAAAKGFPMAQNDIGWMTENGWGVKQDYQEALRWYRLAAAGGNGWGQNNVGRMYLHGTGVDKDYREAWRWFHKAVENGSHWGQYNIGRMYHFGWGVKMDHHQAVAWYRKSAAQNNPEALDALGNMYFNGHGVAKDETVAVRWYRKAAEQGYAEGQFNLAWMLENGRGVGRNLAEARKWYRLAAAQNHAGALKRLAQLN
jgi:TPR repeat protein